MHARERHARMAHATKSGTPRRDEKDATRHDRDTLDRNTLAIALLCACNQQSPTTTTPDTAAPKAAAAGVAHPELWPKSASPDFKDAETEAFVSDLMAKMSAGGKSRADDPGRHLQRAARRICASIRSARSSAGGNSPPLARQTARRRRRWIATARAFRAVSLEQRQGHVPIPVIFGIDAVHGNNNVIGAVIFPHNIGLGAANDPALIRRIGEATAAETAAAGFDWAFGPTLAVPQNDRWGRAYEGYSEDPALVRRYAGEMVRGLQGEPGTKLPLQHGHVAASAKHFLGDGGTKDGIDQGDNAVQRSRPDPHPRRRLSGRDRGRHADGDGVVLELARREDARQQEPADRCAEGTHGVSTASSSATGTATARSPAAATTTARRPSMPASTWRWRRTAGRACTKTRWRRRVGRQDSDGAHRRRGAPHPARQASARPVRSGASVGRQGRRARLARASRARARGGAQVAGAAEEQRRRAAARRPSAKVLVAGAGADDIGQQSGGWTSVVAGHRQRSDPISRMAQTIFAGLREAVAAGGGTCGA